MSIQLKISGGFGGPATWQEFTLNAGEVCSDDLAQLESMLIQEEQNPLPPDNPMLADGQTYEFKFGDTQAPHSITVTDANISPELIGIARLIKKHAKSAQMSRKGKKR